MPNEMVETPRFIPTAENTYVISYPSHGSDYPYDFAAILAQSRRCEREGDVERACNLRYDGIKKLIDLIPDEDEIWLDWEDRGNQTVLELLKGSAIDHFLVGDFEMAAGLFEMELDMDPEDHLEATKPLAYCYVALGEYESFDEIVDDISDKYPEKEILKLWSEFRRTGRLPSGEELPCLLCRVHVGQARNHARLSGRHRERETLARSAGPRAVAADRAPLDAVPGICRGVEKAMIPARPVFLRVDGLSLGRRQAL